MTHLSDVVRGWLGWCPNGRGIPATYPTSINTMDGTITASPDSDGGPRDTGVFRVPRDMLGMLIAPVRTFRNSKNIPLSRIILWYALLVILNSLFWSAVVYSGLSDLPTLEQPGSLLVETTQFFTGLILQAVLIIGISSLVLHGFGRVLGGRGGIRMTLRAFIYGTTPVLLIFGMGTELQYLGATIHGFNPAIIVGEAFPWIVFLWAAILVSLGLRELQGLSIQRALCAVIVPAAMFLLAWSWLLYANPYHFFTFSTG